MLKSGLQLFQITWVIVPVFIFKFLIVESIWNYAQKDYQVLESIWNYAQIDYQVLESIWNYAQIDYQVLESIWLCPNYNPYP